MQCLGHEPAFEEIVRCYGAVVESAATLNANDVPETCKKSKLVKILQIGKKLDKPDCLPGHCCYNDNTSVEGDNATIQVFLNGEEIDTAVEEGMTPSQVDALVAANLDAAGVDASVSSGYIQFTNIEGQQVNQVSVSYAPNGVDNPASLLSTSIVFPAM